MLTWVQILTRDGGTEDLLKVKPRPPPQIFVPDELIWEILLLLPVKSLMRFKCVGKSWKLIISDRRFVKLHLHRSSANTTNFAHIKLLSETRDYNTDDCKLHVSHYSVPLLFSPQCPKGHLFHPIAKDFRLLGVCNGLISFTSSICKLRACYVCFWNPAIRSWSKMSPPLPLPIQPYSSHKFFGFGYDGVSDTYKVVTVVYYYNDSQVGMQNVVNVYNMRASCWRSIQSFPHLAHLPCHSSQNGVYVSNTLNWILKLNPELFVIVSLDLATEEQLQMPLPYLPLHADADDNDDLLLGPMKDSLCVLHKMNGTLFAIWQMKVFGAHESWIQLFNFDFEEHLNLFYPVGSLIGFVLSESHDEVLLMSRCKQVLYNRRENTFQCTDSLVNSGFSYHSVQNYVESLVSPC